jgi:hypothetical protein
MALISAKVIARVHTTYGSELKKLSWEWIMRSDGSVCYRLTRVGGRRERNPWQLVVRVPEADLQTARGDHSRAVTLLAGLARERGQEVNGHHG